jgi:ribosomal protein L37AE/L43A
LTLIPTSPQAPVSAPTPKKTDNIEQTPKRPQGRRATTTGVPQSPNSNSRRPKPYSCPDCQKQFVSLLGMRGHAILHTPNKPYLCHFCKKKFRYRTSLTHHANTAHRATIANYSDF